MTLHMRQCTTKIISDNNWHYCITQKYTEYRENCCNVHLYTIVKKKYIHLILVICQYISFSSMSKIFLNDLLKMSEFPFKMLRSWRASSLFFKVIRKSMKLIGLFWDFLF